MKRSTAWRVESRFEPTRSSHITGSTRWDRSFSDGRRKHLKGRGFDLKSIGGSRRPWQEIPIQLSMHRSVRLDRHRTAGGDPGATGSKLAATTEAKDPMEQTEQPLRGEMAHIEESIRRIRVMDGIEPQRVLGRVGHQHEPGALLDQGHAVDRDTESRRIPSPAQRLPHDRGKVAQVGDRTAPMGIEVPDDLGIETHRGTDQPQRSIQSKDVDVDRDSLGDGGTQAVDLGPHAVLPGEEILRPTGKVVDRGPAADCRIRGKTHRAVTPHHHQQIDSSEQDRIKPRFGRFEPSREGGRFKLPAIGEGDIVESPGELGRPNLGIPGSGDGVVEDQNPHVASHGTIHDT